MKRIILWTLALLAFVVGGGLAFLVLRKPDMRAAPSIRVEATPARVERGALLFRTCGCADCHSVLDMTLFSLPPAPGGLGKGKVVEGPGTIVAVNLTSDPETGIGRISDGQLVRAIREGIGHDGRVLFPMMPYMEYRQMSDEDVQAVVAYLRTLPAVKNPLPKTAVMFPVNLLIKSAPKVVESVPEPDRSNQAAMGAYITKIYGCYFCHTPFENNQTVADKPFAGGHEFELVKGARVVSPNITPDRDTGIGTWNEKQFLDKFAEYRTYAENGPPKVEPNRNTLMPWLAYARLPEEDLKTVYAYLRTMRPVSNGVVVHPDAPEEKKGR